MIGDPKRREQANKSVVNLEDQHSNSKPSFQWEGNVWRIWEKRTSTRTCPRLERSKFQVKTFCFNKQETYKGHRRREPAQKSYPQPQRPDFQVKDQDFQLKINPSRWRSNQKTYICSFWQILEIIHKFFDINTNFICSYILWLHNR